MTLGDLMELVPPPSEPVEAGSSEAWPEIEKALGTRLPQDYKDYVNTYGKGTIGKFIWPFNPFSANRYLNLLSQVDEMSDILRVIKHEPDEGGCHYPIYPEPDGLLPWGITDNGNALFWQTIGEPDHWTVVATDDDMVDFTDFNESMTSFLVMLLLGKIESRILPTKYLAQHRQFDVGSPSGSDTDRQPNSQPRKS